VHVRKRPDILGLPVPRAKGHATHRVRDRVDVLIRIEDQREHPDVVHLGRADREDVVAVGLEGGGDLREVPDGAPDRALHDLVRHAFSLLN